MIKKRYIVFIYFLFSLFSLNLISTEFERFNAKDPKSNEYSKKRESYLLKKEYVKTSYDDFSSTAIFKIAYKDIYGEEYTDLLPSVIGYYKMPDKLYYCMLNDYEHKNEPPLMTFLILQKKDKKEIYYKINYNLTYELVEKDFYDTEHDRTVKKTVKVFY